uniref:C2H2-type domain-containing protein n=1 Tax=Oryza brachyantha TaxID=4533 RepID=J3LK10_ORYBR
MRVDTRFLFLLLLLAQVAPDAIKQKGHIAGRVPESELRSDARVGLAERPPVPEDQGRDIDDGPPAKKPVTVLEATKGACGFSDAVARLEGSGKTVTEVATEPAAIVGAPAANGAVGGQECKEATCRADESAAELVATGVASFLTGASAELDVSKTASFANLTVTKPRVSERVSLVHEAATETRASVSVPKATKGASPDGEDAANSEITRGHSQESAAKMEVTKEISLVSEAAADTELAERVSVASEHFTEPGVKLSVPESPEVTERVPVASGLHITGFASLDKEGAVEPEVTGSGCIANEASEMKAKEGGCIFTRASAEPEDTGRASVCSGDDDIALDEPRPPDCVSVVANVKVGNNAGEAVASKLHPSRANAESVDGSTNSTSNGHVSSKSPTADEVAPPGGCVDTPSVSCLSDIVARSIGKSGRTDIICYARRKGKRKLEMVEVKEENVEMDDSAICDQYDDKLTSEQTGPCESVTSTAVSVEIKIADIKRELEDSSTASKGKRKKGQRFECEIDYCRMTFKTRADLSVHKKNTCTVKSCGRHFRSHKYLRRHQSIHNDDMPYKCPWEGCSMAFKWSWDRGEHFQVHTGKKPYKCTTPGCSKVYKFVSDFTRHRRRCKPER